MQGRSMQLQCFICGVTPSGASARSPAAAGLVSAHQQSCKSTVFRRCDSLLVSYGPRRRSDCCVLERYSASSPALQASVSCASLPTRLSADHSVIHNMLYGNTQ